MKYKIGDKVRVKSLEWYNKNKNKYGAVNCSNMAYFQPTMLKFCGNILTIKNIDKTVNAYIVEENSYYWVDDMFEELVEEKSQLIISGIIFSNKKYADKVELCLGNDYEIVVENGKTFVQKKKPKYPMTYEECCDILKIPKDERYIDIDVPLSYNNPLYRLTELLICRDAYWKIAGEEMGLGKPWVPDWSIEYETKYVIEVYHNNVRKNSLGYSNTVLAFPTKEMRDTFYENFKELIEKCTELL